MLLRGMAQEVGWHGLAGVPQGVSWPCTATGAAGDIWRFPWCNRSRSICPTGRSTTKLLGFICLTCGLWKVFFLPWSLWCFLVFCCCFCWKLGSWCLKPYSLKFMNFSQASLITLRCSQKPCHYPGCLISFACRHFWPNPMWHPVGFFLGGICKPRIAYVRRRSQTALSAASSVLAGMMSKCWVWRDVEITKDEKDLQAKHETSWKKSYCRSTTQNNLQQVPLL